MPSTYAEVAGGKVPFIDAIVINACLRDGRGGSPTVVVPEPAAPLSDSERCAIPVRYGTSHAVFVSTGPVVGLRFFTSAGELPACGHGTVAALAYLGPGSYTLRAGGRTFEGAATGSSAAFDPGPVTLRQPTSAELAEFSSVFNAIYNPVVASVGRERLLVPVESAASLAALAPDLDRLRTICDHFGLLGCYAYSPPVDGRGAARMFAPSIGVPEDIANANSTACLAAHLGLKALAVDMGDAVGRPATITATVSAAGQIRVGGQATAAPRPAT